MDRVTILQNFGQSARPCVQGTKDTARQKEMIEVLNMPAELHPLMTRLLDAGDGSGLMGVLNDAALTMDGFVKEDVGTFSYAGYQFIKAIPVFSDMQVQMLQKLNPLELTSVPRLVTHIKANPYDSLLVVKYPGDWKPGQQILPYSENRDSLAPQALETFHQDIKELTRHGYYFPHAGRSQAHWGINPATGHIVVPHWDQLDMLESAERKHGYLGGMKKLLEEERV